MLQSLPSSSSMSLSLSSSPLTRKMKEEHHPSSPFNHHHQDSRPRIFRSTPSIRTMVIGVCCCMVVMKSFGGSTKRIKMVKEKMATQEMDKARWEASHEWAHQCVHKMATNATLMQPFGASSTDDGGSFWNHYQLGDCFRKCTCEQRRESTKFDASNSFMAKYYNRACSTGLHRSGGNLTILQDLLREHDSTFQKADPDVLVIHIRLGDVIEFSDAAVVEMLMNGANPAHPSIKFKGAIQSIKEYLVNINATLNDPPQAALLSRPTRIEIVGGSSTAADYHKSIPYVYCLEDALSRSTVHDLPVSVRIGGRTTTPDQDFYYMSHAKRIILSTGWYSRLAGKVSVLNGGQRIGRIFS